LAGRARRWQRCARGFDSCRLHQRVGSAEPLARLFLLLNPFIGGAPMMGTYSKSETESASLPAAKRLITKPTRKHPRMKVSVPVMVFSRGEEITGRIVDLSLTGALIVLPKLPDLTRPLEFYIKIPNMHVIFVIGAIVRFDVLPACDGPSHLYGLAVHFSNISDEDRLSLSCLLKRSLMISAPGIMSLPAPWLTGMSLAPNKK
jgi:PilZ domain